MNREELKEAIKGKDLKETNEIVEKYFKEKDDGKVTEKNGIIYTPIEVVDFINNSIKDILKKEFGKDIGDADIEIMDPFTGTGTFMKRFIETCLTPEEAERKNKDGELTAIEIMPESHEIAQTLLDKTLQEKTNNKDIKFNKCFNQDTFQMYEDNFKDIEEDKPLL